MANGYFIGKVNSNPIIDSLLIHHVLNFHKIITVPIYQRVVFLSIYLTSAIPFAVERLPVENIRTLSLLEPTTIAQSLFTAIPWISFTLKGVKNPLSKGLMHVKFRLPSPFIKSPGEASAAVVSTSTSNLLPASKISFFPSLSKSLTIIPITAESCASTGSFFNVNLPPSFMNITLEKSCAFRCTAFSISFPKDSWQIGRGK